MSQSAGHRVHVKVFCNGLQLFWQAAIHVMTDMYAGCAVWRNMRAAQLVMDSVCMEPILRRYKIYIWYKRRIIDTACNLFVLYSCNSSLDVVWLLMAK